MSRRAARVAAVEVLYGADVRGRPAGEVLEEREGTDAYCSHLVEMVESRKGELDRVIGDHALQWRPERMSSVDRNVLRVAVLELLEKDVPQAAVIDEAVHIAKRFSGEEAGRFVNGVLEAVRQSLLGGRGSGEEGTSAAGEPSAGDGAEPGSAGGA